MPLKWEKGEGKENGRWRYEFNRVINGRRYRSSKLLPEGWNRSRAEAFERQETAKIYAESSGIERPARLIAEAVQAYKDERLPVLKNGHKAKQDLFHLRNYYKGKSLEELPDISVKYAKENADLAPATIRNRLAYLKAAVRYFCKKEKIPANYTMLMELPTVKNERHVYKERREVLQLMRACKDLETRAIMKLAFYTGLRWRAEILTLTKKSIVGDLIYVGDTKNGSQHAVPIHPKLNAYLKRIPFKKHDRQYYEHFEAARTKAKMPEVTMHTLRHSFASEMLTKYDADLRQVAELLNHKSLQATKRYTHLNVRGRRELINRMGKERKR